MDNSTTWTSLDTLTIYGIVEVVQALFIGGLVNLGVISILLLSRKPRKGRIQQNFWRVYIAALMLLNLGFLVICFLFANCAARFPKNIDRRILNLNAGGLVLIATLADGVIYLALQRCGGAIWLEELLGIIVHGLKTLFGCFPYACSGGWVGLALGEPRGRLGHVLRGGSLVCNAILHVFATIYITVRLVLQRRIVTICLGPKEPTEPYLSIITIIIESAIINVPTSIAGAIGFFMGRSFGSAFANITATCQSFASVLILHQVALGRVLSRAEGDAREDRV
ncbi:hypothetical protein P691DRAFT_839738 [Macrolepiota fuliginosa MF-IS2]|uniref:Uncharacterized protein n=1 Tax=Macrolepiota fuliginosa MF-IS2 TaxID=1400762 RepID=A0A9P5X3I2_9AGAR|nr:hypothetical protein P691DRAFT_839738 [Macrolepiota fuliginosa MF-IS2]